MNKLTLENIKIKIALLLTGFALSTLKLLMIYLFIDNKTYVNGEKHMAFLFLFFQLY